jgi:hypothetical protein
MEFIKENAEIITIAIFAVTLILLVILLIINGKIYKSFGSKRFAFNDMKEYGVGGAEKWFSIIVSNKSLNDATITAIGVCYRGQYIDCKDIYKAQNNITPEGKIVIMQRTFIKLLLGIDEIQNTLFPLVAKRRICRVKAYIIDSFGNMFKAKAKTVTKTLNASYRKMLAEQARSQKEQKARIKEQKRAEAIEKINVKKIKGEKLTIGENLRLFVNKVFKI